MQKSESEIEKVKVRSSFQAVAMLLLCKKVKVKLRKWKWEAIYKLLPCCCHAKKWKWESKSEKQLPSCCHAKSESKREKIVAMLLPCKKVKVKVRSSFQAVAMLLPCKKWKWTWESESEKQLPSCWHVVAMQKVKVNVRKWKWERAVAMQLHVPQEELPLNILCRLCCQWKLPSCICRTGNRIAAVQQLKFHFWAGLFSQRLSVSVLIKVLSWIPLASPLTSNDRLLPLKHNWDLMQVGKMCEVVDVQMDVNVVAMLLPCCCHSVERFCTHILLYRKRNCRWANCAIIAMLLPCCCYAVTMLSLCFRPLKKRSKWG